MSARRHTLVGRHARDALNQLDAIERHAELFGNELRLRGIQPLPHLALAGVCRDAAVRCDRQPAVDVLARITHERGDRLTDGIIRRDRERNDQRARSFEHGAP